jgi:hypothetical protein
MPLVLNPMPQPKFIINDESDASVANISAFGAFANKNSGIVYNDLTGSFLFMSLDGSICFFVLYHYESNCILAYPIKALDDTTIFEAYKKLMISPRRGSSLSSMS